MGIRYTPEQLTRLRGSPLVIKPLNLPPAEEWMGPPLENARSQSKTAHPDRIHPDRPKLPLLDHTNRRPPLERHISRGAANPDDIILGPPKTSFVSATSLRNNNKALNSTEKPPPARDADSRDRHSGRKVGDEDDGTRGIHPRARRGEGDQDSDGWSTVKPRKSFGNDGAERFTGRMGGDRRFRDRDDRDPRERPVRGFDTFSREKDGDQEQEGFSKRNGGGRGRTEPSWFKESNDTIATPGERKSNGDKYIDRNRGWREKEREEKTGDRGGERGEDGGDRRWEKDRRQERNPEWMDEPAEQKKEAHTQEDFQKWKERMKAGNSNTSAEEVAIPAESLEDGGQGSFLGLEKPKVETPLIIDTGPDKFFGQWANLKQDTQSEDAMGSKNEGPSKTKTVGKSSRFTSFFAPQEDPQRRQIEPLVQIPTIPQHENFAQASKEKEDFQRLLQKLQSHSLSTPSSALPSSTTLVPKQPSLENPANIPFMVQDPFQQYRAERPEPTRSTTRDSQQALQDLLGQRQTSVSQPSARPEHVLQELVNQRQSALSQSSSRPEQAPNRNAEFLMGLMQQARAVPEAMRMEQMMLRMPPPQHQPDRQNQQQVPDLEQEMQQREQRERSASQRQQRRPEISPGFYDEVPFQRGPQSQHEGNSLPRSQAPPQPTQILQRPPPGLDQLPPNWGAHNSQLPPPMSQQQRLIAPPPGLPGGPSSRGMPGMPQNIFPPGFPLGAGTTVGASFGHHQGMPDGMITNGLRNMPPPPPGFLIPPPGFMAGPGSGIPMNTFQQGPEMAYGGPFDSRGAPQGGFRRQ